MAQTEHLPIYKAAYDLCLYFEQIVRTAVKAPDIWVGTRAEIAEHVLAQ